MIHENNEPREKLIIGSSYEILKSLHYSPQSLNDSFSERVFDLYIKSLDYSKMYFTKDQIDILSTYKTQTPKIVVTGNWRDIDAAMSIYDKEKLYELAQITPGGEYIYELRRK